LREQEQNNAMKYFLSTIFTLFTCIVYSQTATNDSAVLSQMRHAAKEGLIDVYYPRNIDTVYGGYLSTFTFDFKPQGDQDKMIVTQSRNIWSTAKASAFYHDKRFIAMSRHGFYFLRDKMWDKEYGGFYSLVTRDGRAKSTTKEAYGNAFAIYGLSAYYAVSNDTAALDLAKRTFQWLEKNSHDNEYGGYFQHMERSGKPIVRPGGTPSGSDLGYKDQNSSIHLLEAFTELYKIWKDPLVKKRLAEMLYLIRDHIVTEKGYLQLFFTPDWKPVTFRDSSEETIRKNHFIDHVSFGHDVETAYLMLEATETLGNMHDEKTLGIGKKMLDHAIKNGWDSNLCGFYDEGYYFKDKSGCTITNRSKNWWAQAEALNTLLLFSDIYPADPLGYRKLFMKEWDYAEKYLIDHEHGDWYEEGLDNEPQRKTALKAHIWKTTYHVFRAFMNCIDRLQMDIRSDAAGGKN